MTPPSSSTPPAAPPRRPGWLPYPALSALLALAWLLLQQSAAPAQLITAGLLALILPGLLRHFIGPAARLHRPWEVLRFTAVVLWDIVVSNFTVARIVLDPAARPRPAWVPVPLDSRDPTVVTLLATVITTTPGTVSCVVDELAGEILVHALDCDDPPAMAAQIKQRYELPLRRIFEGVAA